MVSKLWLLSAPLALATTSFAVAIHNLPRGLQRLAATANLTARAVPANTIYGVNLGSWFVFEPYMATDEWNHMGGANACGEFELTQQLGQTAANCAFQNHWATWITQDDVGLMKQYGLNSVRIPLGFWIIESTVNPGEFYPQGGLDYLRAGCKMLNDAGISVLLDLHAAPGAQVSNNAFAGRCENNPGFWTQANFDRMVAAARQLVNLVHTEPTNFGSVYAIEALNEPPTDGNATPGYQNFLSQFVAAVRDEESKLGVPSNQAIATMFMDNSWQWQNRKVNPADVTNGPAAFDTHLYYSFGAPCGSTGCVTADQNSHVSFACSGGGGRIGDDSNNRNLPLVMGEWWLAALPGTANDNDQGFYERFGDAQKWGYGSGKLGATGWYFWSWKMNPGQGDHLRSYVDAVQQGYLTKDASAYFNPSVCG